MIIHYGLIILDVYDPSSSLILDYIHTDAWCVSFILGQDYLHRYLIIYLTTDR